MIRILQLSDIHWKDKLSALDTFKHIREGLVDDVKRGITQEGLKYDGILICGDVAFSGAAEQYDRAAKFIKELCKLTGLGDGNVFVVPGNHDKNWYAGAKEMRELVNRHVHEIKDLDEALAEWLQKDLHSTSILFTPFKNYDKFVKEYGCREALMHRMSNELIDSNAKYSEDEDKLYWNDELGEINGYTIFIYGLNSALFSDKEDYDDTEERRNGHKMHLSKLAYNSARCQDGIINISMMHHPTPYIEGGDMLKEELDKLYHVQLYGHVHVAESDNNNNRVHIFSGAMQPDEMETGKAYRPIYNIIELDVITADQEDFLTVKLQERYWDNYAFQNYRAAQNYIVKLPKYKWSWDMKERKANLPDGVTKHEVRVKFINNGRAKSIINKLSPDFYDEKIPKYYNIMRFLEKVRQENRWQELWNEMY